MTVLTTEQRVVRLHRTIAAPPDRVYEAWLKPGCAGVETGTMSMPVPPDSRRGLRSSSEEPVRSGQPPANALKPSPTDRDDRFLQASGAAQS